MQSLLQKILEILERDNNYYKCVPLVVACLYLIMEFIHGKRKKEVNNMNVKRYFKLDFYFVLCPQGTEKVREWMESIRKSKELRFLVQPQCCYCKSRSIITELQVRSPEALALVQASVPDELKSIYQGFQMWLSKEEDFVGIQSAKSYLEDWKLYIRRPKNSDIAEDSNSSEEDVNNESITD